MDTRQLYAPPVAVASTELEAPAAWSSQGGLDLSDKDWETVGSLARWMRFVSVFYFLGAAWMVFACVMGFVALAAMSASGSSSVFEPGTVFGLLVTPIMAVLLLLGGLSLRQSAKHFYGVIVDAEDELSAGFTKLRRYLMIYGGWVVLQLISTLVGLLTS